MTKICFLVDLNLDFACKYGLWSLYYYGTIGGDMGPRVKFEDRGGYTS